MANLLPTKGNLIAAKRSRMLAQTGYELMDRKRNILIRELMGMMDTAKELQGQIDAVFTERTPPSRRPTSAWASATASRRRWMWTTP